VYSFSRVSYIHIAVQPISRTFLSYKTETLGLGEHGSSDRALKAETLSSIPSTAQKQTGEKSGGEGLGMSVWSHQADGGVSPEVH
jgi:hypothetical protein